MKKESVIFKNLFWIIREVNAYDKKYILILIISVIISGISPPITLLITQKILNSLQVNGNFTYVLYFVFLYICFELTSTLYNSVVNYYKGKFSLNFNLKFNKLVLEKASRLQLEDYENSEIYDFIKRAKENCEGKLISYLEQLATVFSSIISVISFLMIILLFNPLFILVVLIFPIIKYFITKKINILSFNLIMNRTNDSRKAWYIQYILTYGDFFKELKTYSLLDYFIKKYEDYNKIFNNQDISLSKKSTLWLSCVSVLEILSDAVLLIYIIFLGVTSKILIGDVMTYMNAINSSKDKISSILQVFSNLIKEDLFIDQLIYFFDIPEKMNPEVINIDKVEKIEFKNVSYKYKNSAEYSLKNISFVIEDNQFIAIVGKNGSGKTTLIKLIMGLYNNYEGEIFINDIDLRKINRENYLQKISTLFQDYIKYEATLRENISYGNMDFIRNDEELEKVCLDFEIEELLKDGGLDCQLGHWFDNGKQVSIGQWQKIALARAFLKDSDVCILDEPNASLDAISEKNLNELYINLLKNKLGIIIVHKFNKLVKKVDKIMVLSDGKLIDFSTHDKLIDKNKEYIKMYNLQNG